MTSPRDLPTLPDHLQERLDRLRQQGRCASHPNAHWWTSDDTVDRDRAIVVCHSCPMLAECAVTARLVHATWGVWGGRDMSPARALGQLRVPMSDQLVDALRHAAGRSRGAPGLVVEAVTVWVDQPGLVVDLPASGPLVNVRLNVGLLTRVERRAERESCHRNDVIRWCAHQHVRQLLGVSVGR